MSVPDHDARNCRLCAGNTLAEAVRAAFGDRAPSGPVGVALMEFERLRDSVERGKRTHG